MKTLYVPDRITQALSQFSRKETVSKSKPLKLHWKATTCNPCNLVFFFTTLKKRREDKKGASHCGNTKWSPAELWQSGNPWQCDFCLLLCIKSRCQEPSPPQPWLNPPCTSLPLLLWPWRRRMITSTAASEQMWPERKGEVWVEQKKCIPHHEMVFVPKTSLNNFTFVFYEKWPRRLSVLHSSAEWGRCEAEQEHAAPATWSVLKQK